MIISRTSYSNNTNAETYRCTLHICTLPLNWPPPEVDCWRIHFGSMQIERGCNKCTLGRIECTLGAKCGQALLLVLQDGLAMPLWVAPPHAWDMSWHGVSGVQCHSLPGIVPQHTEHCLELRHIALQAGKMWMVGHKMCMILYVMVEWRGLGELCASVSDSTINYFTLEEVCTAATTCTQVGGSSSERNHWEYIVETCLVDI